MDLLRSLFGNLSSGIVRLAVTGGVLFMVYLFIVKPVLKTTDNAINTSNRAIERSIPAGINDIGGTIDKVTRQVQRQIRQSFQAVQHPGGSPRNLVRCIQQAQRDVGRIQRCARRF